MISGRLLREVVAGSSISAEARVSPLALSLLIQFIGVRRIGIKGYRDLGYSAGILRTIIEDHLSQSAHGNSQALQEALARQLTSGDAGFGMGDLGLGNLTPDQTRNVLSGLSSPAVHILRSAQGQEKFTILEEWMPSLKASLGTPEERYAACLADYLAKKNESWRYWTVKKRGFGGLIGRSKYLLASSELSKIDKLEGYGFAGDTGVSAYIEASRRYKRWRRGGLTSLVLCVVLLPLAFKLKPNPYVRNLPTDFDRYSAQLSDLSFGCMADNLKWLPSNLAFLEANCESIKSLEGIPPNLAHLGLSRTSIESLDGIPASVRELDISSTLISKVDGLGRLRPTALYVNQIFVPDMKLIPDSVRILTLAEGRINKLDGLPRGLTDLELRGTTIQSLKGIPNRITSLRLIQNTNLVIDFLPTHLVRLETPALPRDRTLVPSSLETLILEGAGYVKDVPEVKNLVLSNSIIVGDFPKCLESLKFTDQSSAVLKSNEESPEVPFLKLPSSKIPERIRYLKIPVEDGTGFSSLPASLWGLDLADSVNLRSLAGLNRNLTELDISNTGIEDLLDVPDSVLTLRFESCVAKGLSTFPENLEHLDLGECSELHYLAHLPESLISLDVHNTLVSALPPDLPKNLKVLDISNTKIRGHLPKLPLELEELILHRGQVSTLEGLPKSVRKLRFREPVPKN